jgi:competence protein ComGC
MANTKTSLYTRMQTSTLAELVVLLLIFAGLAFIVLPKVSASVPVTHFSTCRTNTAMINRQMKRFYAHHGVWPQDLSQLTEDKAYFPQGPPECQFGIAYSLNQSLHTVDPHSH